MVTTFNPAPRLLIFLRGLSAFFIKIALPEVDSVGSVRICTWDVDSKGCHARKPPRITREVDVQARAILGDVRDCAQPVPECAVSERLISSPHAI